MKLYYKSIDDFKKLNEIDQKKHPAYYISCSKFYEKVKLQKHQFKPYDLYHLLIISQYKKEENIFLIKHKQYKKDPNIEFLLYKTIDPRNNLLIWSNITIEYIAVIKQDCRILGGIAIGKENNSNKNIVAVSYIEAEHRNKKLGTKLYKFVANELKGKFYHGDLQNNLCEPSANLLCKLYFNSTPKKIVESNYI